MDGQAQSNTQEGAEKQGRQRSTIGFPYMDLESAIKMAEAIHNNVGLGECEDDQLAAWTSQSGKSSTFRVQVYASRMFGVITGEASQHRITELGRRIVDSNQARAARIEAFLSVPLYAAVFEKYKGGTLPPVAALEREMVGLGVSDKQKDRARQVFERAADQAGFFEQGRNRLVQPGIATRDKAKDIVPSPGGGGVGGTGSGGGTAGGGGGTGDALLDALISKLPPAGTEWGIDERIAWLSMMAMGFQITYGAQSGIEIKAAQ